MYLLPGYEEVWRAEQTEAEVQLEKVPDEGETPQYVATCWYGEESQFCFCPPPKGTLKKKTKVASEESVTTATTTTVHQKLQMGRWKEVKKVLKEAEKVVVFTPRLTKAIRDTRRHSIPHCWTF